ncbi:MAG TPA: hypothetical protein VKC59_04035 [Candidatus Limnocylindrales bacterium]|nr:hypothetical protein [Candidatus Limnocylindrales bacterium]
MSPRRRPPRWTDTGASGAPDGPDDDGDAMDRMAARVLGYDRLEAGPDGREWAVRPVSGQAATKVYRCPGCDHEIQRGVPHVVAWPADEYGQSVHDRRHWHTPCWKSRGRRRG